MVTILIYVLTSISCTLSIFGSLLILGTYYHYQQIRKPARSLLFWLSVTDLGTALSYGMAVIQCGGHCNCLLATREIYTLLGIFFPVSSFLWTDCIALYIYAATYQKTWIAPRERLFCIFHIICWGLPAATCISIAVLRAMQIQYSITLTLGGSNAGGWCWIQQWQYDLLGGKVIEIFSYIFLMSTYILTWKELKRIKYKNTHPNTRTSPNPRKFLHPTPSPSHNAASNSMLKESRAEHLRKQLKNKSEAVNRLLFIPVVFVSLRIWGTAHMFINVLREHNRSNHTLDMLDLILSCMQALCDPLQGFCNGILFVVFVSEVRYHLFNTLKHYIGYRWLDCCGLICCCHYCCSCFCNGCNACFDCCLLQTKESSEIDQQFHYRKYIGTDDVDTNYYATKYQYLPKNENQCKIKQIYNGDKIQPKSLTISSPSISSIK
eukprot:155547_1